MSTHPHPIPRATLAALALASSLCLGGCWEGLDEEPPVALEEAPPRPLVELLYAGEYGPRAAALGDEVRVLLWLRRMDLSAEQLGRWRATSRRLRADDRALREQLQRLDEDQAEALGPLYAELRAALSAGPVSGAQLADFAGRLEAARAAAADPRRLIQERAEAVLAVAQELLDGLDSSRRSRVAEALFFLRRAVGPDTHPESWDVLIGRPWPAGDFATLRRSASPEGAGDLDISQLWTLDGGETQTTEGIGGAGRRVILALALLHPALDEAAGALLGDGE